jgi:anti-anti-sigma factor
MLPGEDTRVIVLAGELDTHDARGISAQLSQAVGDTTRAPVIDVRKVTFLDSTVLAVLAHAAQQLRNQGRDLTLAIGEGRVREFLEHSGLVDRFVLVSAPPESAPGSMPDPAAAA